jgi:hypothetical protein
MKSPGSRIDGWNAFSRSAAAWWQRWREPILRLGRLCYRIVLIVGYAWVGIMIRLPVITDYLPLKNVLICLAAVILIGKAVLDTLFYDHYRP